MPRAAIYISGGLFGLIVGSILSSHAVAAFTQIRLTGPQCPQTTMQAARTLERRRQLTSPVSGFARPRNAPPATPPPTDRRVTVNSAVTAPGGTLNIDWRRIDLVDTDDDGLADLFRMELADGRVLSWRIVR